jgi:hypothetical protein
MKFRKNGSYRSLVLFLALFAAAAAGFCQAQETLPFRINRISDRVIILMPGQYANPAVTTVIVTDEGLIRYPFTDGNYGPPEGLPPAVNSPTGVAHGYIAPDSSFLVFDASNRPGSQGGEGDLYVCFRNPDGTWGDAQNLGDEVNTPGTNFCPSLSPDGKYLFFAMYKDIYWVSTEVILRLKSER